MKKIVSLMMVLVMLAIVLTSCGTESEAGEPNPFADRFATCDASSYSIVIVDRLTGVCYLWRKAGYGAGMTVLLDADGTPLLYEEAWQQVYGGGQP